MTRRHRYELVAKYKAKYVNMNLENSSL